MNRLLAEDLLLLCWNDEKGAADRRCSSALPPAVGGALLLDAVLAQAVSVEDGRIHVGVADPADPLLVAVVDEAGRRRRPPKTKRVVQRVGGRKRVGEVRDRLVAARVLSVTRRRFFGVVPYVRYPLADIGTAIAVRDGVRTLLLGQREPDDASAREVMLAGLAKPAKAIDLLVERTQRKEANERAQAFGEGHGVPTAVGEAVQEAQAATMAAVAGAVVATSSSSSG